MPPRHYAGRTMLLTTLAGHGRRLLQTTCTHGCPPVHPHTAALLVGLAATLSGVGMARFAYTALMPHLVHAGWFSSDEVAALSAANLLGYLAGALLAHPLSQRWGATRALAVSWVCVALSFAACSLPQPVALFFGWRMASGVAGAVLMVLGPSVAMAALPASRRARLGPVMFCGVGAGAVLAGSVVPWLAAHALGWAWWVLCACCAVCAAVGMRGAQLWGAPTPAAAFTALTTTTAATARRTGVGVAVVLVLLAYGLDGFGFVPHTVFWADYLDRELGLGPHYAAWQWMAFGTGAIAGPLCVAYGAQRWGWGVCAVAGYALKAAAVALPLLSTHALGHAASGAVVGALSPGLAAITSGYLMQLLGPAQHKRWWGWATAWFALLQAGAGVAMAGVYVHTGSYRSLFVMATFSLAAGLVLVLLSTHKHFQNNTN